MKERGKGVETFNSNNYPDFNYSSSDHPCKKHPSSASSVGICAYCLKDRLVKLVCSDCGEQRLSSCSCSEISSSYPNSCIVEVGSVGRISFLVENERTETNHESEKKMERSEDVILLKRSSSSCVEIKKSRGFWRFGRLFRKKINKGGGSRNGTGFDEDDNKSEMWVSDYMGVSRSRSLCSFRGGGGGFNYPDECSDFAFSSAKMSDVTEKQCGFNEDEPRKSGAEPRKSGAEKPRKSGFKGVSDSENGLDFKTIKKNGGSMEIHSGYNNVPNRSVFPVKESDINGMDESGFIDLNLDLSLESKPEFSAMKMSDTSISAAEFGGSVGSLKGEGVFGRVGSCRISLNDERGIKKGNKRTKVLRWIFKHQPGWKSSK